MITHRQATQPPEPPVRFYKIIAISFFVITAVLLAVVIFITTTAAYITIIAKNDKETVALRVPVAAAPSDPDTLKGSVSTSVFRWSSTYHPVGTTQVRGASKGTLTITNTTGFPQPLVKTTRFLSDSGVLFRLAQGVTAPAHGSVVGSVYADAAGPTGDIAPTHFTIPGLMVPKQKLIYAQSNAPMIGGQQTVAVLSADDLKNAEADYQQKVMDAFQASLPPASAGQGRAYLLVKQTLTRDHKVGDQVSAFTINGNNTLAVVTYRSDDLSNIVSRAMGKKIDATAERFLSVDSNPTVTVVSDDAVAGTAQLSVNENALVTLDANVDKLAPSNFFGKSKDEIQRYVLGLDHVASVDVRLSPWWTRTAPAVLDRVHVVVKNMQ